MPPNPGPGWGAAPVFPPPVFPPYPPGPETPALPGYPLLLEGPPPPPPMRRRSKPMMIGGMLLTGVGTIATITGAFTLYSALSYPCQAVCTDQGCVACSGNSGETSGIVMIAVGGVSLAAGIPLLILGAQRVPADPIPPMATLVLRPGTISLEGRF